MARITFSRSLSMDNIPGLHGQHKEPSGFVLKDRHLPSPVVCALSLYDWAIFCNKEPADLAQFSKLATSVRRTRIMH